MTIRPDERREAAIQRHFLHLQARSTEDIEVIGDLMSQATQDPAMGAALRRLCQILIRQADADEVSQLSDVVQKSLESRPRLQRRPA
jgi:hypothetical protein